MSKRLVTTSKFLSLVLRHQPELIGLSLDAEGWVAVDTLLNASHQHGTLISRDLLDEVVRTSDKQRFAISSDGNRIRANQGHSVNVDLELETVVPPSTLYHGTVDRFLSSIRDTGLTKQDRHHVHLSANIETAEKVGKRRGKPVVLTIESGRMTQAGHAFYLSDNGVWLTDHVPVEFIRFPEDGETS